MTGWKLDAPCPRWLWFWLTSPRTGPPTLLPSLGLRPQIPACAPPGQTCCLRAGEGFCPLLPSPARSAPCQHSWLINTFTIVPVILRWGASQQALLTHRQLINQFLTKNNTFFFLITKHEPIFKTLNSVSLGWTLTGYSTWTPQWQ